MEVPLDKLFHHELVPVGDWTLSVILLAIWLVVGFLLARWFFFLLRSRGFQSESKYENILVKALPIPLYVLHE